MPDASLRAMDMRLIDDLFEMGSGYVLDFSDRTFGEFFQQELAIDIDHPRFRAEGTSKAKRLRYLLKISDPSTRVRILNTLWEYRGFSQRRRRVEESIPDAQAEFNLLVERIEGRRTGDRPKAQPPSSGRPAPVNNPQVLTDLKGRLLRLTEMAPQPRGFEFERFLKTLFDANGLGARASFRLTGEQIDGSFELAGETYLLEAKWTDAAVGAADLRAFNGKAEEKAAWTRGLFVSNSGFTEDGLIAFGRGKRVVCMDGLDLYEVLDRGLSLADALGRKIRRAAESGQPFVRIRDLYP
ncbi:MAG TPA: restriction endonuclease [Gemmatimonadaceae bacterium]